MSHTSRVLIIAAAAAASVSCGRSIPGFGVTGSGVPTDAGAGPAADGAVTPFDFAQPIDTVIGAFDAPGPSPCANLKCALGCNVPLNRCNRLRPSNFPVDKFHGLVSADLANTATQINFNTDTGEIRTGGSTGSSVTLRPAGRNGAVLNGIYWATVKQPAGYPELSVWGVRSLRVASGTTAVVAGSRAFALYAAGDAIVEGAVFAPPVGSRGGPGGFAGGLRNGAAGAACFRGQGVGGTQRRVTSSTQVDTGGGGAGRGAQGGAGGRSSSSYPAVAGGAGGSSNGASQLSPLYGGCGAGAGAGPQRLNGGFGGGGGGAVQISANGLVTVGGVVNAPGGAGEGGHGGAAGGGGGSGGAVLLEGVKIEVRGTLSVNGGGGGSGSSATSQNNAPNGTEGRVGLSAAPGGARNGTGGGAGGAGGARVLGSGTVGVAALNGGGGGGAVGRVRFNAPTVTFGSSISPHPTQSNKVQVW